MSNPTNTENQQNLDAYNGWTNYQTWVTALWIGNDRDSDEYAAHLVEQAHAAATCAKAADPEAITAPNAAAADTLQKWITDLNPLATQANVFADLISNALGRVHWREIAEHYRDDRHTA